MEKYYEHKYKHLWDHYVIINAEGYEVEVIVGDENRAIKSAINLAIETGYANLVQGPGTFLKLDMERGLISPDGGYHDFCIPPNIYEELDDEIKEKLK
jgi:hypothetical protein